ncbi:hypothetical protein [Iningainema tapete]|uniref:Uncharacterized protein n=1 Tax=Iningainema tapete BLCC-T55 TaxID=2748662 RepID=A0A8J6XFL3_9CYAN|nr:hypothetical protein [Iningainema tapete]MBD2772120.1 hypothetical protein [Iningainema tapete BLCC-T55]
MKSKFKTRVVRLLQEINSCVGIASILATTTSVGIVLPASVGLTLLASAGVGAKYKPFYERVSTIATATGLFSLVGTISAAAAGSLVMGVSKLEEKEETVTRTNQIIALRSCNSSVDGLSDDSDSSDEDLESEDEVLGLNDSSFESSEEEDEQNEETNLEVTYTWRQNSIYTYYVTQITGHPVLCGLHLCRLSSHCGTKSEPREEIASFRLNDHQVQKLAVLFEVKYPERENLVGKYFHSRRADPTEALEEYFQLHNSFYWAKLNGQFKNACLDSCLGCSNLHGADKIVCALHPFGWSGIDCPDKKLSDRIVLREYSDQNVISALNEGLNNVEVFKMDKEVVVKDSYSGRSFYFDFDGFRLPFSDKLPELGEDTDLRDYVHYFKYREIVEEDYSHLDKIRDLNKGLYGADIRVDRNRIVVYNCSTGVSYSFKFNGQPIDPYDSNCPCELRYNYNLISLVNYFRTR